MADAGKITIDHAFVDNLVNVLIGVNDNLPNLDVLASATVDDTTGGGKGGYLQTGLQTKVGAIATELADGWKGERKRIREMVVNLKKMQSAWKDIESGSKQQADFFKSTDPNI